MISRVILDFRVSASRIAPQNRLRSGEIGPPDCRRRPRGKQDGTPVGGPKHPGRLPPGQDDSRLPGAARTARSTCGLDTSSLAGTVTLLGCLLPCMSLAPWHRPWRGRRGRGDGRIGVRAVPLRLQEMPARLELLHGAARTHWRTALTSAPPPSYSRGLAAAAGQAPALRPWGDGRRP